MGRHVARGLLVAALVGLAPGPAHAAESGKAFTKLTRGLVNLVTGWVEIPKRVMETSQQSGYWTGFTWGIVRGIGYAFVRTAAGGYELVTFPFPAPQNYEPVIQPEFVFTEPDDRAY